MRTWLLAGKTPPAGFPRFICLGLLLAVLLACTADAQSNWPALPIRESCASRVTSWKVLRYTQPEVSSESAADSLKGPPGRGCTQEVLSQPMYRVSQSSIHPPVVSRRLPASDWDMWGRSWRWSQTDVWSALPPLSAFSMQPHLRKYQENWPTPGATVAREEPEVDEDILEGGLGD
jgi:hypothetical protein